MPVVPNQVSVSERQLLVVGALGQTGVRAVVARGERRVVDVDDEHAHAGGDGRRRF